MDSFIIIPILIIFFSISYTLLKIKSGLCYIFFGITVLISVYGVFIDYLLFSRKIIEFPHLFRTSSPTHYLIGCLHYFFIIYLFNPERKLKFTDLLHLLPFTIHTLDLMPFFLESAIEKEKILHELLKSRNEFGKSMNGNLPTNIHLIIKYALAIIYFGVTYKKLIAIRKAKKSILNYNNKILMKWATFDNLTKLISFSILLIFLLLFLLGLLSTLFKTCSDHTAKKNDSDIIKTDDKTTDDFINDKDRRIEEKDTTAYVDTKTIKEIKTISLPNVQFFTNSSVLIPSSKKDLEQLAVYLLENQDVKAKIIGHTDNVGSPSANMLLSQNRAESVRTYLVSLGVNADRIKAIGKGSTEPKTPNDTEEGRLMNRRVEVELENNKSIDN
mgnify:CR=1 FL=1